MNVSDKKRNAQRLSRKVYILYLPVKNYLCRFYYYSLTRLRRIMNVLVKKLTIFESVKLYSTFQHKTRIKKTEFKPLKDQMI